MAFSRAQLLFLACLGLLWAVFSCSRAQGIATPPSTGGGNVAASDRVHVDARVEDVLPGTYRVLYTVPSNRWLIVTDLEIFSEGLGQLQLEELAGQTFTCVRSNYFLGKGEAGYHSDAGMRFRPGSRVVIRNLNLINAVKEDIGYTFSGYLLAD